MTCKNMLHSDDKHIIHIQKVLILVHHDNRFIEIMIDIYGTNCTLTCLGTEWQWESVK